MELNSVLPPLALEVHFPFTIMLFEILKVYRRLISSHPIVLSEEFSIAVSVQKHRAVEASWILHI